jgi:iron complex outermembrane recepter protein
MPAGVMERTSTPSRIDTLSDTDVRRVHPSTFPDVLEPLPGVTLQSEQGTPRQPDLTLRGFTVSSVTGLAQGLSVLLDGVRLNEPTAEEVNFDLIPLDDLARVQLIRGPSVLFGRNTLGGALSLTTRRGQEVREIVPEIAAGSFGHQDYRLRLGGMVRPFDYALSLSESLEDGFRDFSGSRVSRIFGKVGLTTGDTDATVSYQYSNDRIRQAGSLPEREARDHPSRNFTPGDFFAPGLHQAIVNVDQTLGHGVTLSLNGFVRSLSSEQFNVNLIGPNSRLFNDVLSWGGRVHAQHDATVLGRRNVLIVGTEYTRDDVKSRTFTETPDERELEADLADRQDAVAAYAQDSLTVIRDFAGHGSSVVLTVAARWDRLRHDIDDRLGGPSGGVSTFSRLNPRAGVNVNTSDRLGFYGSYGEGFRAPAFLELTCAGPGAVCPGLQAGVAPDPPLQPVTARTYEIGAWSRPRDWLDIDASVFRTDLSDDIFSVAPTGTTGVFFQNVGRTRRQGVELAIRARPLSVLELFANWSYTRATFQDRVELATPQPPGVELINPGDSLSLVPQHRATAGLAYHPTRQSTISFDVHYVDSQFMRGDEANHARPLPSYWFANAGGSLQLRGFEVFVRIQNVLNQRYETFGTFAVNGREPGTPVERFLTPAPSIAVQAGVSYSF